MRFQKKYIGYTPILIVIAIMAVLFSPLAIRRSSAALERQPLSPEDREVLQRWSSELRELAE